MKRKIKFNDFIVICIMTILYILPVSTSEANSSYNIFYYARLICIPLAFLVLLKTRKVKIIYFIFIIVFAFRLVLYEELSVNIILLMSCLYLFDYLMKKDFSFKKIDKIICISSDIFLMQLIIATILKGQLLTTSFIRDNNYTGYFIFFLYVFFLYTKKKRWLLWCFLALFTYSRATIIATILLMFLYFLQGKKEIFNKKSNLKILKICFLVGQILIIPISYFFVNKFNNINYQYELVQGFNRLNNIMDNSNYLRFMLNILAFESINVKHLLIGLQDLTFAGIDLYAGKTLFPHNTLLALYIHLGMVVSIIYIYKYIKLFEKYNYGKMMPIYFSLIIFQLFLGPSSFYGVELLVFMIIIIGINQYLKEEEGEKRIE